MSHPLESIIGYTFKNPELLETALTHTSYANETRPPVKHNERLEFLGDSVLQIVSADYLFHAYADRPEGDLTRIRASLVSEGALFQFAQEIHLGEYLRLGRGEERCGGRTRPSVVSDAFEAVIAALYLDGGMEVARNFILPFITEGKHAEAAEPRRAAELCGGERVRPGPRQALCGGRALQLGPGGPGRGPQQEGRRAACRQRGPEAAGRDKGKVKRWYSRNWRSRASRASPTR